MISSKDTATGSPIAYCQTYGALATPFRTRHVHPPRVIDGIRQIRC